MGHGSSSSLIFFTFETLLLLGMLYLSLLPIGFLSYKKKNLIKTENEDEHEDIL